jgi:hypothetical protein
MDYGKLKPLTLFWAQNNISRTQGFYLSAIGRGPKTIAIGSKEMVTSEAEDEWLKAMAEAPIRGSLKKHYLAAKAARETEPALATA